MLLEGQQLDHYRFVCLLGSGGMSDVYLAQDLRHAREVAIKVIWTDTSLPSENRMISEAFRHFLLEVQLIAGLSDDIHILPLYDSREANIYGRDIMYMVMPYRREGSLADWLRKHRNAVPLSPWMVEHIVYQAASALQYAHDHKIIHRDVKPANFLLYGETGRPSQLNLQLADFGIAKSVMTTNQSQIIRGTPAYMAPERWEGRAVPASDQYALAVMAYELLTGQLPFVGSNQEQMQYQHSHVNPQLPSMLNPNIPRALDAVLLHALAKKPRDRFRSVSAFADAFRQAIFGLEKTETVISLPASRTLKEAVPEFDVDDDIDQNIRPGHRSSVMSRIMLLAIIAVVVVGSVGLLYFNGLNSLRVSGGNASSTPSGTTHQAGTSTSTLATATFDSNATATTTVQETGTALAATATVGAQGTATVVAATATVSAQGTATAVAATVIAGAQQTATAVAIAATATAYATAVTSGTQELSDSLQDNSSGYSWDVKPFPGGGSCAFTGGAYHVSMSQNGDLAPCFAQATNFSNFSYQVQMTIVAGDQGGIIFRANAHNGSFYSFSINRKGEYALERYNYYNPVQPIIKKSNPAIKTALGQANLVAVVAYGGSFDLYVNGQQLITVSDSAYSSGQIGVTAEDINNPTEVVFSNAQVWSR